MLKLKVDNEEQTKIKLQKESNRLSFPLHEDPNFQKKISLKKEFQLKYDGNIQDVVEKSKDVWKIKSMLESWKLEMEWFERIVWEVFEFLI